MIIEYMGNWRGARGDRGLRGVQGLPGAEATPQDAAVGAWLGPDVTSATKTAAQALDDRAAGDALADATALGNRLTKVGVVIGLGATGEFDNLKVESLTTIFSPEAGRFVGVYTGYGNNVGGIERASIGRAYSDDGIVWYKSGVMLSPSGVAGAPDQNGCTGPLIVYEDGLYHLFYIGLTATGYEGGTKTICRATSPSLTNPSWTRQGIAMQAPYTGTSWYAAGLWHPSLIKVDGLWYCYLNASAADGKERIGFATATTLAGPWTFATPHVIDVIAGQDIAGDPCITRIPGGYRMDFFRAGSAIGARDYYATTTEELFPWGWTMGLAGAAIVSPSETYDSLYAHKPFIAQRGGRTFHYYTAVSATGGNPRTVALAMEPDPWAYQTIMTTESDVARTTSGTAWATAAKSTAFFDAKDKLNLQVRILVRGASGATNTLTVRDSVTLVECAIASGTAWANAASPWKTVDRPGVFDTHCDFRSSDAGVVTLGSIAYEFRWIPR
ncbi:MULTISPECIES: family 43 glycosylhydrolase [unclassified Cryobacterium]|uniref:family 43 glycosylhydrolase n=1 Tax=unclassified Cryobacterium TaxID=2649013 RepID=UPI00106B600D|nr:MULTISPECIES: family 43 glycosylhydrolase [unclassified Cryobacterium]TFC59399.1 hypothetical protein E3O68_00425 [Cryobacterium sp. TMB3-1-2]TFC67195.1 hypothetical protein E3T21_17120 [Cryobacterium sp. TMB3-15]TFC73292.1 hypothetical protein E3T22_16935 [Cryobacterium sp. TMB3-10]TFD46180.1 hypothetical protein E3T58_01570 [Cryobacterium sp. TMB3-12]